MTKKFFKQGWMVLLFTVFLIAFLFGCAAKKQFWGDPSTGLILHYHMPKDQVLKYKINNVMKQSFEMMGQPMETNTTSNISFTVNSKGQKEKLNLLGIKIDSIKIKVTSPMRDLTPDMSTVVGKSFEMTLSQLGKELNLSGAEEIKYDLGQEGKRSISPEFQTLFPDLASKPVKVGDSWVTKDTISFKEETSDLKLLFETKNTLAGFETVEGMECAKITATSTGTLEGEGQRGLANLYFEGDIEAKDTWYFAYKKGVFVKTQSEGFTDATIAVTGAQKMTIPMTMETKMETRLVK